MHLSDLIKKSNEAVASYSSLLHCKRCHLCSDEKNKTAKANPTSQCTTSHKNPLWLCVKTDFRYLFGDQSKHPMVAVFFEGFALDVPGTKEGVTHGDFGVKQKMLQLYMQYLPSTLLERLSITPSSYGRIGSTALSSAQLL